VLRRVIQLSVVTLLSLLLSTQVFAQNTKFQEILNNGVIRIAVPMESPPFGYLAADGAPTGLDIEMAQMVGTALNVQVELVSVTSADRVAYLVTDKADLVISNLGLTPERAKQILYSAPYVNTVLGVFGPKDLPVNSPADLGDYTISATRGAAATDAILRANPNAKILQFEADSPSAQAYISGQTNLLASSSVTVAGLKQQNPDKEFELKFALRSSPAHMGVRMGEHDLVSWLNTFIYFSQLNGELDRLSQKYLGVPLQPLELPLPTR
jgi:polar amino acid transport system substrate-binding protein